MSDRDLAEAIYANLTSPAGIDYALELWHEGRGLLTERDRFDLLLPVLARSVIDAVLARRQREIARTGPWDGQPRSSMVEEDGYPGSLLPPGWPRRSEP